MRAHRVVTTIWTSCVASAIAASWVWCMFYVQRFLSEPVRPGTVVSVLFLIVLGSANYWGVIPSLAAAITAAMFFVTYFQPPLGKFAATPQGWVSTTSFVLGSLLVSHLSARARRSAAEAIQHSRENQLIEQFGRGLLACSGSQLVASTAVNEAVGLLGASAAAFEFVPEGGSHRSGPAGWEWSVPERLRREALAHGDWVRDASCQTVVIPLVLEHTPVAFFGVRGAVVADTVDGYFASTTDDSGPCVGRRETAASGGRDSDGLAPKEIPGFPFCARG